MKHDGLEFQTAPFPSGWAVPSDCQERIMAGGIADDCLETYYLVDLGRRCIDYVRVDMRSYADEMNTYLHRRLPDVNFIYDLVGSKSPSSLFRFPHKGLRWSDDIAAVAMNNCGYIRFIDFEERRVWTYPEADSFEPRMFSATNAMSYDGRTYYYAEWSLDEHIQRCINPSGSLKVDVWARDVESDDCRVISTVSTQGCIHEVSVSPDGQYLSLTEFFEETPCRPPAEQEDVFEQNELWREYRQAGLYDSRVFLMHMPTRTWRSSVPPRKTPAHVQWSEQHLGDFYLSCHNMSMAHGKTILHGNGSIVKYRVRDQEIEEVAIYEGDHWWRVTSLAVFTRNGASYVAVTLYPNRLAVIEDRPDGKIVRDVILFDAPAPLRSRLHFASLGRMVPLWLTVSSNGRYIVLMSNDCIYIYDWELDTCFRLEGYSMGSGFAATCHLANFTRVQRGRDPINSGCVGI